MPPEKHALLGASNAHRWLQCTPSARLEEKAGPDEGSPYAAQGTEAHALAELELSYELGKITKRQRTARMKKRVESEWHDAEMEEAVASYVSDVMGIVGDLHGNTGEKVYVDLEKRVDYSAFVPGGFGTADVAAIAGNTICIVDLKYGKGVPVSAEANPQLRLYALGALLGYRELFDLEQVRMTIIQPRLGSVSTDAMSAEELLGWAARTVAPAAKLAFAGEGVFAPSEGACRFCRAKALCRARADGALAAALPDFGGLGVPAPGELGDRLAVRELMTVDEIAGLLPLLPGIVSWAKDIQDWALKEAVDHEVGFPGFKLVEGRSNRKISDPEAAMALLDESGLEPEEYLKPYELQTITSLEKKLGKKRFGELLGDLVEKPAGKPALVPESDKRPVYDRAAQAMADFGGDQE